MKSIAKRSFVDTIPVMTGYIVLGIGFGILLNTKGYGVSWALLMSVFIYAGSMQYVAIDFLGSGATLIAVALTTLMVNCRHLFYGISMIDKYKDAGILKPYLIFALTDETYSLVCRDLKFENDRQKRSYYFLTSIFNQCYWVTGSVIGVLLGMIIPFDVTGIDFSLTALFLTIVVEQWLSSKDHSSAIIGFACSIICLIVFDSSNFLIPTMILITIVLTVLKYIRDKKAAKNVAASASSYEGGAK